MLFCDFFKKWVDENKVGFIREVTLQKYKATIMRLTEIAPDLVLEEMSRKDYQLLLNKYAETHEKQTTMDFHHHLKSSILDAIDEGIVKRDITRKAVIRGMMPREKSKSYLDQHELEKLMSVLELSTEPNWDWLIFLLAKTGIRFAEGLGVTPEDFDFEKRTLRINKTWNYKDVEGGFIPTKNESSNRMIDIDARTAEMFKNLVTKLPGKEPIFVCPNQRIFNSTVNNRLGQLCEKAKIPVISLHKLRHTHASLLIFIGVSIQSVSKRLGHANTTTTQESYLHIIRELENKDKDLVLQHLARL